MLKIFPLTAFLIFCLLKGFSFSNEPGQMNFSGHTEGRVDSIKIKFSRDFLYNMMGDDYINVPVDARGNFSFSLDNPDHPAKMTFEIYGEPTRVLENFVSESGDSIFFLI